MLKKVFFFFILFGCCVATTNVFADALPYQFKKNKSAINFSDSSLNFINHLTWKEIEKLSGHKLNFKERIALKLYRKNTALYSGFADSTEEKKLEKKALWSKWLGIGSLIGLLVPAVGILSLPAAIIAIVFGASTIHKVKNKRNSRQGITFGIITIAVILLVVALVVLIVSSLGVK